MFNALLSPAGDDLKSTSARMTYGDYSGASSASMAHVAAAIPDIQGIASAQGLSFARSSLRGVKRRFRRAPFGLRTTRLEIDCPRDAENAEQLAGRNLRIYVQQD
jgi:hypothetical protein